MDIIKPEKLNKGDLIGIISPASTPDDISRVEKGAKYLEGLGYNVEVGKNVGKIRGYLAGEDDQRLSDLHYMFSNTNIKAIFCVRGGYGAPRLLDKIDFNLIKKNPKIFVGYSDITSLQMAFLRKAGLVTFAGPMIAVDFYNEVSQFTEEMFWALVTSKKKFGAIHNPVDEKFHNLTKGKAAGRLVGGNLAVLSALAGTPYFPEVEDKILLLEEIGEAPYRIDRMFNHFKLMKVFDKIKGLILGRFVDCYETNQYKHSLTLNDVVYDYFRDMKIPVVYNFKHGHIKDNITLAYGLTYKIDTSRCLIEMTESAVE